MRRLMTGQTVSVELLELSDELDELGGEIKTYADAVEVSGVLVAPANTDNSEDLRPYGVRLVASLAFPADVFTDGEDLRGARVTLPDGTVGFVNGAPVHAESPLKWDMLVDIAASEG